MSGQPEFESEVAPAGAAHLVASDSGSASLDDWQLLQTQQAFDSVAADYDGPRGNNELIQRMRLAMWDTVGGELDAGSKLIDLGCGTGLDALEFAQRGYQVLATDWSPCMVERTRARARAAGLEARLDAAHIGIQQLQQIEGEGAFDGMYSNFGPLNCAPDLDQVAAQCARLLRPGGCLVFSVIGRVCPWEMGHYLVRGRIRRATIRAARGAAAVGMNGHTIWTYYYTPREFYRAFAAHFSLQHHQAMSLFMPPPYLVDYYRRHRRWCERLGRLDDRLGRLPLLRGMGDHFLMVMRRR